MPPSKGPFSANIHPITLKLSVPIPEGRCFRKMVGAPFENERIGAKNPSEITLSTPAGTPETSFMPPSKGPFSANIHPITPKLSVPIPEGMCFRKMVGGPFEKWTDRGQKSTSNHHKDSSRLLTNPLKVTFQRSFLHEYASDHSQLCCAYSSGHVLSKRYGFSIRKCTGIGKNNAWNHP